MSYGVYRLRHEHFVYQRRRAAPIQDLNLYLLASTVNVGVVAVDADLLTNLDLTGTLVDVAVADLDASLNFKVDLNLTGTNVDIAVADLDTALNLTKQLNATIVDITVADEDGTINLDKVLLPDVVNVVVVRHKAVLSLAGEIGGETGHIRRLLMNLMGSRR